MQHTKGPWKAVPQYTNGNDDPYVKTNWPGMNYVICRMVRDDDKTDEGMANARLIAAAPDLLEVCEELHQNYMALIESNGATNLSAVGDTAGEWVKRRLESPMIKLVNAITKAK